MPLARSFFADRNLWLMAAYGFVAGLPLPLTGFTLRQWLAEDGVSLAAIGLTANIGLAYALKFLWSPAVDHLRPPAGLARFGRRRGWLLVIQPLLALACAALALSDPRASPALLVSAALLVAFLSASQDIVIDAWRIETFAPERQGAALAAYVWGYRAALLVAGAGAIWAAGVLGWHGSLLGVAALVGTGVLVTLAAREPRAAPPGAPPKVPGFSGDRRGQPSRPGRLGFGARLREAVVEPFRDILRRPGAGWILAFVALFKLGEQLGAAMDAPFYRAMGFVREQVALATGVPGLVATLAGAALGGLLVARIGTGRALVVAGFGQMASQGLYFMLAVSGGDTRVLLAKVVLERVVESMADAAFLAYLSALCSTRFTATQYALLSSLAALGLRTIGGLSGVLAAKLGWTAFYGSTILAALPAMLIMLYLLRRFPVSARRPPDGEMRAVADA